MPYKPHSVSKLAKILFPIIITAITGFVSPKSVVLIGFLMFGNLIRECGVLDSLSETAQKVLANLVTIFLGITIASRMKAEDFLTLDTLMIIGLGLIAFIFDTAGGVIFAKILNLFLPKGKDQPDDRRGGNFRFPDVCKSRSPNGLERRQSELPAYAFDRRKCLGTDSVRNRGRYDPEPYCKIKEIYK